MPYYSANAQDRKGNALGSATVTVGRADAGTVALYSNALRTVSQTNPITTDENGLYAFYTRPGLYTLIITKTGFDTQTFLAEIGVEGMESVTDFGAKGDGVTDDTAALIASEAAAFSASRPLYIPNGKTFLFDGSWTVRVSVYGTGTIKQSHASVTTNPTIVVGASGVKITGITVDSNSKSPGIRAISFTDIEINGVAINNSVMGAVAFYLCTRVRAVGCTASGVRYATVGASGLAADGFYFGGCVDFIADRCEASNFRRIGFVSEQEGVVQSDKGRWLDCTARDANNCDDSLDQYNAGFWAEHTNSVDIDNCIAYDIAGNTGQTTARIIGLVLLTGSSYGVHNVRGCRIGDAADGNLPKGISISGSGLYSKINVSDSQVTNYKIGVAILGDFDSAAITDVLLINGTSGAAEGGVLIDGTGAACNSIALTRVREINPTYSSNDSGTVNQFAAHASGSRVLTIDGCQDCTLVLRQGFQRLFVSNSGIQKRSTTYACLNALQLYLDNSRVAYVSGNTSLISGSFNSAEAYCSNSRFESAAFASSGTALVWQFTGCTFDACALTWDGSGTLSRLKVSGGAWSNGPSGGCIVASVANGTKDTVIVQGVSFHATNVANTPVVVGGNHPDHVILHGNNYNTTTFTNLVGGTVNSQVNNIQTL